MNLASLVEDVFRPAHCWVAPPLSVTWQYREQETIYWELFRGRALDRTQTRQQQTFESWCLVDNATPDEEPLIAVRWDATVQRLYVTRSIRCYAWEGYEAGGQILSRETIRRVRELVGTIELNQFETEAALRQELITLLSLAVHGTSRLPLTSLEAPLPAFSLGQFVYCYHQHAMDSAAPTLHEWLSAMRPQELTRPQLGKILEAAIRGTPTDQLPELIPLLRHWHQAISLAVTLRDMFNDVALTPYTDFVTKVIALVAQLVRGEVLTPMDEIDLLTYLQRQIGRHLTSFDLLRFHHRGANYPDALMLDEITRRVETLIVQTPSEFLDTTADGPDQRRSKQLRRRGIRMAWLLMQEYQGHLVPDAPTSPGENARVLPAPWDRVPEQQILQIEARTRRLFEAGRERDIQSPILDEVRNASIADFVEPVELRELGTGLFLDRPLGCWKLPGEPDATVLLSYVAFSRDIARRRLERLGEAASARLHDLDRLPGGIPVPLLGRPRRPGVAALDDALLAAPDFELLHTTRRGINDLLDQYRFEDAFSPAMMQRLRSERWLILPTGNSGELLSLIDSKGNAQQTLRMNGDGGYVSRGGCEYLANGFDLDDGTRIRPRLT